MRRGIAQFVRGKHTSPKLYCLMHVNAWVSSVVETEPEICANQRLDRFLKRIEISL